MILEISIISVSLIVLFMVYFARLRSDKGKTFLFSEKFLNRADEIIFDFVKFIFKLYSLLFHNISAFISRIPHKVVNYIHSTSHAMAKKSSIWIEKITHKSQK